MNILGYISHKAINVTANTKKPQAMRDEALEGILEAEGERKEEKRKRGKNRGVSPKRAVLMNGQLFRCVTCACSQGPG